MGSSLTKGYRPPVKHRGATGKRLWERLAAVPMSAVGHGRERGADLGAAVRDGSDPLSEMGLGDHS